MNRKRRGRGEGGIYQRDSDGLWVGTVSLGYDGTGRRRRKTVYGQTKGEAAEQLRKLQNEAGAGRLGDAGQMTVADYLTRWLTAKHPTVATHTYNCYDRDVAKYLTPHLGHCKLAKLQAVHVEQLYAALTKAGVSPSMQKKAGTTLRTALQHAVHPLRLIAHNPAADVPKPKYTPPEMQVLDQDQVGRVLTQAKSDRLYAYFAVAIDSACRPGELFALSWADADFPGNAISITKTLEESKGTLTVKEPKTKKSRRRIALSTFTMKALAEHRKQAVADGTYQGSGPVFCDTDGGHLRSSNFLRRSFRPILDRVNEQAKKEAEKAGMQPNLLPLIRPYDLRHTGATLLLAAGENIKVVSERLGHSTTKQTLDTYSHVLPEMQEQAASKMDAMFRGQKPVRAEIGYRMATVEG